MIGTLVLVITVALSATALFGLVTTALNRPPSRVHAVAVGICVALIVVQAAIAAYRVLLGGVTLPEQSTFLIYLAVAVCVPVIALQFATAEPSRWGGAVIAVGAIGTLVAVLRLQGLWIPGVPGA
ncbi:hypothetical protein FVA95_21590 [Pseudonocardia sp. EV170527-09]|uniref:hypothetical protein n=1 Tax=Pseudonocardia sp. EV170527-09 TaxID=2603411 RepID=UPI0011F20E62|nr:hypothetical protein [Pseudonocardia sp. EV170527-09]KAA1020220.1 hypothetical protein FVA95_21590 [Pseudonocardia sp. EV170527-09]